MTLRVEEVEIDKLVLDPQNARKHSERQLKALATSLHEFGQQRPAVVGSDNVVYAGNGMITAALALGWKKISIVKLPFDDPKKCRAFAIADNRTADLATWDNEQLLETLKEIDKELLDAVGFNDNEIDDLTALLEESDDTPLNLANISDGQSGITYGKPLETLTSQYANRTERAITLNYPNEIFVWVVQRLQSLREDNGYESNAEAIMAILANHFNERPPEWITKL